MKKNLFLSLSLAALCCSCSTDSGVVSQSVIDRVDAQMAQMLDKLDEIEGIQYPRTMENGKVVYVNSPDWTVGYFPGSLWYLSQLSKANGERWEEAAKMYTEYLDATQYTEGLHDTGVMMMAAYGSGAHFGHSEAYGPVIIQTARTLMKRFNPQAGVIQSWGRVQDISGADESSDLKFPVIIDGMIILENFFEATALSQDSTYHKAAVAHADATMKNHFRADYSSFHLVNYSPVTGKALDKKTVQGYKDDSSWARGQGWGLYGYTVCYRYTRDEKYLEQAKHIARYILDECATVDDGVFYWDYDFERSETAPRDASAAALVASALYELQEYTGGKEYLACADRIIKSLSTDKYLAQMGDNGNFLLMHSVGHYSRGIEVDEPLNYADYYFLEALYRRKLIDEGKSVGYRAQAPAPHGDREVWLGAMDKISRPVFKSLAEGTLIKSMPAGRASRGKVAQLEAVGRGMYGIAPWLVSESGDERERALRAEYRDMIIKGLTNMADPTNADYIRFDVTSQNLVDAAFFAHALLLSRDVIWDKLSTQTQQSLVESLAKTNKYKPGMSNWLLFSAMVQVAIREFGGEWDDDKVHFAIDKIDSWYKGDGTYGDGYAFHQDYYNSFVIQPMMLYCVEYLQREGIKCSADAEQVRLRLIRYAEIQERLIAPDGTYPLTGRSICYRFGAFHALADAAMRQILPYWVKPAQVRSAMTAVIEKQMSYENNFDEDGWLKIGVYGYQPTSSEPYISTGSLYLINFAFLPLGLPTDDPFWMDPYTEWTSVKAVNERYLELDMALEGRLNPQAYMGKVKKYDTPQYYW